MHLQSSMFPARPCCAVLVQDLVQHAPARTTQCGSMLHKVSPWSCKPTPSVLIFVICSMLALPCALCFAHCVPVFLLCFYVKLPRCAQVACPVRSIQHDIVSYHG